MEIWKVTAKKSVNVNGNAYVNKFYGKSLASSKVVCAREDTVIIPNLYPSKHQKVFGLKGVAVTRKVFCKTHFHECKAIENTN